MLTTASGRDFAQAIAKAERELAQALDRQATRDDGRCTDPRRLADKQNELADSVASLDDVLKQLKMAAAEEQPELVEPIGRAAKTKGPRKSRVRRKNAATIAEGRHTPQLQLQAGVAAGRLEALAQDSGNGFRRSAIAPGLEPPARRPRNRPRNCRDTSHDQTNHGKGPGQKRSRRPRSSPRYPRAPARDLCEAGREPARSMRPIEPSRLGAGATRCNTRERLFRTRSLTPAAWGRRSSLFRPRSRKSCSTMLWLNTSVRYTRSRRSQ